MECDSGMKWREQSYCYCLCIRASQVIALLLFCKIYVSIVYLLAYIKSSVIGQTGIFDVPCCLSPKNLIEFSLDIYVTKSTLDDFGRWSYTISATP